MILEEIKILKKLRHPNIPKFLGLYMSATYVYLVLEYVKGDTLFYIVNHNSQINESQSAVYMKSLLEIVRFCHKNGIIHGDIKPANIIVKYFLYTIAIV